MLIYVDDIIITRTHPDMINNLVLLMKKEFPVKDLGSLSDVDQILFEGSLLMRSILRSSAHLLSIALLTELERTQGIYVKFPRFCY